MDYIKRRFFKKYIKEGNFYTRDYMEVICKQHLLNVVPLTTLDNTKSVIANVDREGIILRYEKISSLRGNILKLKIVEKKRGKKNESN